jgi:hypothetical protein
MQVMTDENESGEKTGGSSSLSRKHTLIDDAKVTIPKNYQYNKFEQQTLPRMKGDLQALADLKCLSLPPCKSPLTPFAYQT